MILYRDAALYAFPNDELDFARKIVVLMDDPDLRVKMGRAGKRRSADELSCSHQEKFLLEAYQTTRGIILIPK
jgi:hypothetical protein